MIARSPARNSPEPPDILTSAGDIPEPYETLGLVIAVVSKQEAGCGGGVPALQTLNEATGRLRQQAYDKGGNGLIHVSYLHRTTTSPGCGGSRSTLEVCAWGTAVRLRGAGAPTD